VKISKQARRDAKELFRGCRVDGVLDEAKVRAVVQQVIATKPRGYLAILEHFKRLVKLDLERRTARAESPVPLSEAQENSLKGNLAWRYGPGLVHSFTQKPELIGGLRVKVGFDVFDGSVRARLAALEENF
jgi:F-type H+-transporting ATPase subunit delta